MGILDTLESAAGSVVRGVADGAKDVATGAGKAASDAFDGAVNAARSVANGGIGAAKDVYNGVRDSAEDVIRGVENGDVLGGLEAAQSDLMHSEAGAIGELWNGGVNGASNLLGGINQGAHDIGGAVQNAYDAGVDGVAGGIGDIAGAGAARAFRGAANTIEAPIKQAAQFTWGVGEGVVEGVGGAVKGIGSLVGDAYKFGTDGQYRDGVISAVESGATYAVEHPLDAAAKVGSVASKLATGIYQGGLQAARDGDVAEYIGKGVGQVAVAVATTALAPEAEAGEAAGLGADAAGAASRAGEALDAAGGVGQLGRDEALLSEADPARAVLGPATESHPEEIAQMRQALTDAGVEVRDRPDAMAYAPGLRPGEPGQFVIDPDASYPAWLHEFQHAMDDKAAGWGGMRALMDPQTRWSFENAAYGREIDFMRGLGHDDVVAKLQDLKKAEWQKIFPGEPYQD